MDTLEILTHAIPAGHDQRTFSGSVEFFQVDIKQVDITKIPVACLAGGTPVQNNPHPGSLPEGEGIRGLISPASQPD
ncbi:MAG: hypothetical protein ACE15F_24550 [bacterium]